MPVSDPLLSKVVSFRRLNAFRHCDSEGFRLDPAQTYESCPSGSPKRLSDGLRQNMREGVLLL